MDFPEAQKYLAIRYIGPLDIKPDNIIRTSGRTWRKDEIKSVQEEQVSFYLRHADEFVQVTPEYVVSDHAEKVGTDFMVSILCDWIGVLSEPAALRVQEAAGKRLAEISASPVAPEPIADHSAAATRLTRIVHAISLMDPRDKRQYTTYGVAKVPAVKEATGFKDVTEKEVQAAMKLLHARAA